MADRYLKTDQGGFFVYAGCCFSNPMTDHQRHTLNEMNASVRRFLLRKRLEIAKERGWPSAAEDDQEIRRIEFLLEHMVSELKVNGCIGARGVIEGYVFLNEKDTIMHRMLFDG